jgi:hypothetical protein
MKRDGAVIVVSKSLLLLLEEAVCRVAPKRKLRAIDDAGRICESIVNRVDQTIVIIGAEPSPCIAGPYTWTIICSHFDTIDSERGIFPEVEAPPAGVLAEVSECVEFSMRVSCVSRRDRKWRTIPVRVYVS